MENRTDPTGHEELREWLTLEREPGELLGREERRRLEEHLATCAACRKERRDLERLDTLLASSRVPVRRGFREDVLRSLPAAGWEGRSRRSVVLAVAVAAVLGIAAVAVPVLLPAGAAAASPGGVAWVAGAFLDMLATGILAATGMLWASWRGVGMALETVLSPGATVALTVLVVSLDVLLLTFLARSTRSGGAAREAAARGTRPEGRRR
ncbi:MAG: zf-HC2 domain-containing protein [Thermoanaerobaculia bacterium]